MSKIQNKIQRCNKEKCPYLYNEDYCLLNEEYLENIKMSNCGIVFDECYNEDIIQDEEE